MYVCVRCTLCICVSYTIYNGGGQACFAYLIFMNYHDDHANSQDTLADTNVRRPVLTSRGQNYVIILFRRWSYVMTRSQYTTCVYRVCNARRMCTHYDNTVTMYSEHLLSFQ